MFALWTFKQQLTQSVWVPFTIRLQSKFHRSSTDDSTAVAIETEDKNENPGGGYVLLSHGTNLPPLF